MMKQAKQMQLISTEENLTLKSRNDVSVHSPSAPDPECNDGRDRESSSFPCAILSKDVDANGFNEEAGTKQEPKKKIKIISFPEKVMMMLDDEKSEDIISWLSSGRTFFIHDRERFESEILPLYFKQSKYSSFARRLRRWGFRRVKSGIQIGAYEHDKFMRGDKMMCMQLKHSVKTLEETQNNKPVFQAPPVVQTEKSNMQLGILKVPKCVITHRKQQTLSPCLSTMNMDSMPDIATSANVPDRKPSHHQIQENMNSALIDSHMQELNKMMEKHNQVLPEAAFHGNPYVATSYPSPVGNVMTRPFLSNQARYFGDSRAMAMPSIVQVIVPVIVPVPMNYSGQDDQHPFSNAWTGEVQQL